MGNSVFVIMLIVFIGILIACGLYARRWVTDASDYVLAGRGVSTPINMMGVIAIGYAGTTIALAPNFSLNFGFTTSLAWGVIYAICGLALYGIIWGKFIRLCGAQTLPEFLEMRFNAKIRPVIAITSVIGMCGILANNIVSCVSTIVGYTGWDTTIVTIVIFLVILAFTYLSGLWAATMTDFFQVCIGIIAIPTLYALVSSRYGGLGAVSAVWPNWMSEGLNGTTINAMALTYPSYLNFIICFAAALVWGNNYYWMKLASCRNEKVARNSFLLGAVVLVIVFMIPIGLLGVFAGAFEGSNFIVGGGKLAGTAAYGFLASTFTPILGSFFVVGACAASISTASTSALGASNVASRDIYQRMINPKATPEKTLKMSKYIMLGLAVFTWVLCQFPGGATYLFAFANCWLVPPAILLLLGAMWPKFNNSGAFIGALVGMISMGIMVLLNDILHVFNIGSYIYYATAGFLITLIAALIGNCFGKSKYYGEKGWKRVPTATNRKDVTLEEADKEILKLIRLGHCYQADITDYMGLDSGRIGECIERLDQGGYIMRKGMTMISFYTYSITDKGLSVLNKPEGKESEMLKDGLNGMYLDLLKIIKEDPNKQAEFQKKYNVASMKMAAISSHLTRKGYIVEKGLFQRKLQITEEGRKLVNKYA